MKYDVIIVGARLAGSATAMLLAKAGLRVLVIDQARFPSDTLFTCVEAVVEVPRSGLHLALIASPPA